MEWDSALVSSKVANVPASDQNKTFHQMYQEWVQWSSPWLSSGITVTGHVSDGKPCSLAKIDNLDGTFSVNKAGAHSPEHFIFDNVRSHDVHLDTTVTPNTVESDCGYSFLCDPEVARVWNDINASAHVNTKGTNMTANFPSDILAYWQGFGAKYGVGGSDVKLTVNPPDATGVQATPTDAALEYTSAYYDAVDYISLWSSYGFTGSHVSDESYVFSGARHGTSYTNVDAYNHKVSCSGCGRSNIQDSHKHKNASGVLVEDTTQCDLCGYRQGMPGNASWSSTQDSSNDNMSASSGSNSSFSCNNCKTLHTNGITWHGNAENFALNMTNGVWTTKDCERWINCQFDNSSFMWDMGFIAKPDKKVKGVSFHTSGPYWGTYLVLGLFSSLPTGRAYPYCGSPQFTAASHCTAGVGGSARSYQTGYVWSSVTLQDWECYSAVDMDMTFYSDTPASYFCLITESGINYVATFSNLHWFY